MCVVYYELKEDEVGVVVVLNKSVSVNFKEEIIRFYI